MLSTLIAGYLFLGGAGAGAFFVLVLLERVALRRAQQGSVAQSASAALRPLFSTGSVVALVALGLSVLCLVADLGRLDRIINLFVYPTLSYMTIGTYALTLLLVCAALLAIAWNLQVPWLRTWMLRLVEYVGLGLALVVMVYTGLFFLSIGTVNFWASPFVPVLFVLSSFSTGIALLLGAWFFTGAGGPFQALLKRLARVDAHVILVESLCVAAFFCSAQGDVEMLAAVLSLTVGGFAPLFWAGFVLCGLAVPLGAEILLIRRSVGTSLVCAASTVLVGGFCLRLCIIIAGTQPVLGGALL